MCSLMVCINLRFDKMREVGGLWGDGHIYKAKICSTDVHADSSYGMTI